MNWIRNNNPQIEPELLQAEVEKTLHKLGIEATLPQENNLASEKDELSYLYTLLDHYAEGLDEPKILKRLGKGAWLARPFLKIFRRLNRNQQIFNFLVLEILREHRGLIQKLSSKRK